LTEDWLATLSIVIVEPRHSKRSFRGRRASTLHGEEGERFMSLAQKVKIESSGVINAPLPKVWDLLREFNNVSQWHPDVIESRIESGSDREPGAVRAIRLRNGMSLRERLVAISPNDHFYKYSVIDSPLPIRAHESTVRLVSRSPSQTEIKWTAEFEVTDGDPHTLAAGVKTGVLDLGIDGLRRAAEEKG
jgi:NADPH2:quinone reductase